MDSYIGITDFTTSDQVDQMVNVFTKSFSGKSARKLMVGAMMNRKSLLGLPNKWSEIYPKPDIFKSIYSKKRDQVINTLHYADYEDDTSIDTLTKAFSIANACNALDAVQFDMIWPEKEITDTAAAVGLKVILQIGRKAMQCFNNDPAYIASKILDYGDTVHGVLFDRSGGLGEPMDAELLRSYIIETKMIHPDLTIAVAGGLGPGQMHLVEPLIEQFPYLSVDAQGKLRRSGKSIHPIDWDLAEMYIQQSAKIFI
jgi:hypothetical protein